MELGFIGLGHMGQPMARNLLKAGHRVIVYNRTRSRAEALAADGAEVAERPADTCRGEAVITMLADDAAVERVVFGEDGILAALAPGKAHISMSTISVALSDRLTEAHTNAGQIYIAAPVFGRPDAAAAAKLFIIVAGHEGPIARYRPLFDAMGQRFFTVAEKPSSANLVKLSGNFLIASMLESLGETVALVQLNLAICVQEAAAPQIEHIPLKTVSLTIGFWHRAPLVGGMATRPNFSTFHRFLHEAFTTCRPGCALIAARNQCVYDVASGFPQAMAKSTISESMPTIALRDQVVPRVGRDFQQELKSTRANPTSTAAFQPNAAGMTRRRRSAATPTVVHSHLGRGAWRRDFRGFCLVHLGVFSDGTEREELLL